MRFVDALLATPGVSAPALGEEWPTFGKLCVDKGLAANDLHDAWLAAAMIHQGEHLVTFDFELMKATPTLQRSAGVGQQERTGSADAPGLHREDDEAAGLDHPARAATQCPAVRQSALTRVHSGQGSSPCSRRPRSRGRTSPSHRRSRTPRPAHAAPSWSRRPSRRAWRSTSAYRSCGPNSCFTSRSVACMRSRRVRRWSWKAPRRDRPQMRRTPRR